MFMTTFHEVLKKFGYTFSPVNMILFSPTETLNGFKNRFTEKAYNHIAR